MKAPLQGSWRFWAIAGFAAAVALDKSRSARAVHRPIFVDEPRGSDSERELSSSESKDLPSVLSVFDPGANPGDLGANGTLAVAFLAEQKIGNLDDLLEFSTASFPFPTTPSTALPAGAMALLKRFFRIQDKHIPIVGSQSSGHQTYANAARAAHEAAQSEKETFLQAMDRLMSGEHTATEVSAATELGRPPELKEMGLDVMPPPAAAVKLMQMANRSPFFFPHSELHEYWMPPFVQSAHTKQKPFGSMANFLTTMQRFLFGLLFIRVDGADLNSAPRFIDLPGVIEYLNLLNQVANEQNSMQFAMRYDLEFRGGDF